MSIPNKDTPRELSREDWFELLKSISKKAVSEAFERNLPITILRGRQVIRLFRDQRIEVLEELPEVNRLSDRKVFNIKPEQASQD